MKNNQLANDIIEQIGEKAKGFKVRQAVYSKSNGDLMIECLFPQKLTDAEKQKVEKIVKDNLPKESRFKKVNVVSKTLFLDSEVIVNEIFEFIKKKNVSLLGKIARENISVEFFPESLDVSVKITYDAIASEVIEKMNLIPQIEKYLNGWYCGNFQISKLVYQSSVNIEKLKKELYENSIASNESLLVQDKGQIIVEEMLDFVGTIPEPKAELIKDVCGNQNGLTICGTVKNITKRESQKGKNYYKFMLDDTTAKISCVFFPSVGLIEEVDEKLLEGVEIISRGESKFDKEGRYVSFYPRAIAFCKLPEKIEIPEMKSKPVPQNYELIFPKPITVSTQQGIFEKLPDYQNNAILKDKRFVVFDLETTGLDANLDFITEIGAISVENGTIKESFSTFVNPQVPIPKEIVELTGITDEMVKNAPLFQKVIPDFFKFIDGSVLVGHNVEFDIKFIDKNAKDNFYVIKNDTMDTLLLARENLKGLSNYKLNTVCEFLKVDLLGHHRAINDVLATAQIFMKLCDIKEKSKKEINQKTY